MAGFDTTRWSLLLAGHRDPAQARDSLAYLCRAYRAPVLGYVRRRGYRPEDAEDLTQAFFALILERRLDASADPARGRFRTLLLTALSRFLASSEISARAAKRGGGKPLEELEPERAAQTDAAADPEASFVRDWAMTLLERAVAALAREADEAGRRDQFARLKPYLIEQPGRQDYAQVAAELGMRDNTIAVAIHRLRRRLRELVREALAETLADPDRVDEELAELREALGGGSPGRSVL